MTFVFVRHAEVVGGEIAMKKQREKDDTPKEKHEKTWLQ